MEFVERYARALGASRKQGDQADALLAAAFSEAGASGKLGLLLHRVKYVDDLSRDHANLAQLLHLWTTEVVKRGRSRKWMSESTAWDAQAARKLYQTVAELSLAHWLDGTSESFGSGEVRIEHAGGFVRERVKDMVSELHAIAAGHAARARARLHAAAGTQDKSEK